MLTLEIFGIYVPIVTVTEIKTIEINSTPMMQLSTLSPKLSLIKLFYLQVVGTC